ncbi:tetratricopeptide repeat protein [Kinneretia aquatilis]|jgi:putative thioredoxin|uniref:tetratricopeptide repeat protein n=1 Tax=Kinneretia aquatilis TaxID=2070761 RepID=UPI000BCEB9C6|nr:tetratricopeptide repeat protein [Paucibacter aquatile]MCZ8076824.1 tetratricopeptide repeat protein [Roseateles sp.]OYU26868.1 MAG: co-chaperone YbbN [Burkholderiales bacterium PBB2]WIV97340.1 tetratricopeptide repeat protein [Paucibacter aquatile]
MIDITLQNFEAELIQGSMQQPVLLDIWAPWCGPCKSLGPVLEKLEVAYAGRFKLAKLNSDEVPEIASQLSQMFGVRSIPFCVMFAGGQPVDGFVGAIPEAQIREFLDKHVPSGEMLEAQEEVAEAEGLMAEGDLESALVKLQAAVETDPANEQARFDYVRALLELDLLKEAQAAFAPVAAKAADTLTPHPRFAALGLWLQACERTAAGLDIGALQAAIAANKRDFEARYALAQGLMANQSFTEAMDELLEIIMRDKAWNGELARKTYVAILELLSKPAPKPAANEPKSALELAGRAVVPPSDPLIDQYRRKLSMALF